MPASKTFARVARLAIAFALTLVAFTFAASVQAQQNAQPFVAPIPPQIVSAKTVFLSNAGLAPDPRDRILASGKTVILRFSQFYSAMQTWGRYQIVDSPSAADLVFEFSLTSPLSFCSDPQNCQAALVEVVIYDAKTHFRLWSFDEPVFKAMLNSNYTKNVNQAMTELMADLKTAAPPQ